MKKILFAVLLTVSIGATAFAAPEKIISHKVRHHFITFFNDAQNVEWKETEQFVKASFILNNEKVEAFYTHDGELLGTSKEFAFDKLPARALKSILNKYPYPEFNLQECIEFESSTGDKNYFVSFEKNDNINVLKISTYGIIEDFNS
jgi:hypothetical protein